MKTTITIILFVISTRIFAQIGINSTNSAPQASAMLDISSVTKGALLPRMTSVQRNAIPLPALGLTVFDTDTKSYWFHNGASWASIGVASNFWTQNGNDIFNNNTGNTGIGLNNPTEKLQVANGNVQFGINDTDPNTFQKLFFWHGAKGALRAGNSMNTEWDLANLGEGSFANGYGTIASGVASVALNAGNTSSNFFSTTMGFGNVASGQTALAMGEANMAADANSVVMGYKNLSNGSTMGKYTPSLVIGTLNTPIFNSLFTIGNGNIVTGAPPTLNRKNALVVLENGNVGIGIDSPNGKLHVFGEDTYLWGLNLGFGTTNAIISTDDFTKPLIFQQGSIERVRIANNGNVGIGNSNPEAPLHVTGTTITTPNLARAYFNQNTGTAILQNTSPSGDIQVRADGYFWANGGGFVATSDARIKNIIGKTDNEADLNILKKIEITNYTYKDNVNNTAGLQKKVIAQQVKSVYPIAVNLQAGIIPNLFEITQNVKVDDNISTIETKSAHDFKTGDLVKLILESGKEIEEKITVKNSHEFTINQPVTSRVFIYGKKVNDLHTVDYDALTTLNISATQALLQRIELLEKENLVLKNDLQNQINQLEAKFIAKTETHKFSKIVNK